MQDDPDATSWGGQNVFDVYTKSFDRAAPDGTAYADWLNRPVTRRPRASRRFCVDRADDRDGDCVHSARHRHPGLSKSILRSKESVLRNNLFTLRTMIDEYTIINSTRR